MKILMKLMPWDRANTENRDAIARDAFAFARNAYNAQSDDSEAYLYEYDYNQDGVADAMQLLDGAAMPSGVIALAESWNKTITDIVDAAVTAAEASCRDSQTSIRNWLAVPSQQRYELKKAMRLLDDDFYAFADMALLINEHDSFTSLITDEQLNHIRANPENYVCITVYPK